MTCYLRKSIQLIDGLRRDLFRLMMIRSAVDNPVTYRIDGWAEQLRKPRENFIHYTTMIVGFKCDPTIRAADANRGFSCADSLDSDSCFA
jgi:hypothetical protein